MPDVQNSDPIVEDVIKDLERIADERCDAHSGSLLDLWRTQWIPADVLDDSSDANFESFRYSVAKSAAAIGRYFAKIGDGTPRIFNPHADRNVRKAASTSSAVAVPLRSASSRIRNSSAVAL